jgi:glyoxylase-like metal-dependent hydrolase (beta-lactamase superfamily II)
MLDIHQISTGRGNAALFVLPDGTTLLMDAGAADSIPETDPHPDSSRSPGAWIVRYLKRHGVTDLDYALITHFHADHTGQVNAASPYDSTGDYRLTGITEVGDAVPIHTLLDRGSPDYSYPAPSADETLANYRRFISVRQKAGMSVQAFKPGSSTQLILRHQASRFPTFEIRNIIGNGEAWTG